MKLAILLLCIAAGVSQEAPCVLRAGGPTCGTNEFQGKPYIEGKVSLSPIPPTPYRFSRDRLLLASLATYSAAVVFDAASSVGLYERFALARSADGRFGARGWAVAAGEVAIPWVVEYFVVRKWPRSRWFWIAFNFTLSAPHWWYGVKNMQLR